jgi:hypothetical protein
VTISDRGIHPDLLDEEKAQPVVEEGPPTRRRRSKPSASADEASSEVAPTSPQEAPPAAAEEAQEEAQPPAEDTAWLDEARAESDPEKMLAILTRHLPKDRIARDSVLAGFIGDRVQHGIRDTLARQEQERLAKQRQEAYQRGDLYTLGQFSAQDLQAQAEAQQRQAELQVSPFMTAVRKWQEKLPPAVQAEVSGKTFAPEGTLEDGFLAYLDAVKEAAVKHGFDEEIKKREPALRKALLSQTVGSESTPELESGRSNYVREITDEEIGAMSLQEYNEHFDERGLPKKGVEIRYTRAIDPRTQQR